MSSETDDMQPVTRNELREELGAFEVRYDAKLETLLGAVLAAMQAVKDELRREIAQTAAATERRLIAELGITRERAAKS